MSRHNTFVIHNFGLIKKYLPGLLRDKKKASLVTHLEGPLAIGTIDLSWLSEVDRNNIHSILVENDEVKFKPDICEKWMVDLFGEKNWDCFVALLLLVFPLLVRIKWSSFGEGQYPYIRHVLAKGVLADKKGNRTLPHLNHVEICASRSEFHGAKHIMPWLKLELISFKAEYLNYFKPTAKNVLVSLHTGELSLPRCDLRAARLEEFLLCFDTLKRFEYEWSPKENLAYQKQLIAEDQDPRFYHIPSCLHRGLQNSKLTLEELILKNFSDPFEYRQGTGMTCHVSGARGDWVRSVPIPTLVEFAKLRIIDCDSQILTGVERYNHEFTEHLEEDDHPTVWSTEQGPTFLKALPPSLEVLIIRDCSPAIFVLLDDFLPKCKEIIPKLKLLDLHFQLGSECGPYENDEGTTGNNYEQLAKDKGITMRRYKAPTERHGIEQVL